MSYRRHRGVSRREWYRTTYLQSDHWRQTSRRIRDQRPWCEVCRDARSQQVHHLTYDNLWREREGDLQAICKPCHERIHSRSARRSNVQRTDLFPLDFHVWVIGWLVVVFVVLVFLGKANVI